MCTTLESILGYNSLKTDTDSSKERNTSEITAPGETHKLASNLIQLSQQCIKQQAR